MYEIDFNLCVMCILQESNDIWFSCAHISCADRIKRYIRVCRFPKIYLL